jgi:uncharacterized protein (DUF983 family)
MLKLKCGDNVEHDKNQPVIGVEIKMIEGTCPKCNKCYYGSALLRPGNGHCEKCGNELLLTEERRRAIKS